MNEILDDIHFYRESLEKAMILLSHCQTYIKFTNPVGSGILLIKEIDQFDSDVSQTIGGKNVRQDKRI